MVPYKSRKGKNHYEFNLLYHTSDICSFLWYLLAHFWRQKALGKNIFLTIRCNCTNLQKKSIYFFYESKGKKSSKHFSKKLCLDINTCSSLFKSTFKIALWCFFFSKVALPLFVEILKTCFVNKKSKYCQVCIGLGRSLTFATRSVNFFTTFFDSL